MITTSTTKKLMIGFGVFALVAVILGLPMDALASDTNTVLGQTKNLATQVSTVPKLIAVGAYIIGTFFAVRALFALKGFIEDADDNPITKVLGFGAVSALMIMLPFIIEVMTQSIGAENTQQTSAVSSFTDATSGW